ncbi:hypothetical protein NDU88_006258 [Pleurodeles waltl]|uniref:Uncharacterized protein n=1 Tax=Pleurodeles waltl TaxID=8319 RepID=A0AAV7X0N5_PLEWA|nr:hypothetical protein NDU88_006258 [Pleurodeles waltl]
MPGGRQRCEGRPNNPGETPEKGDREERRSEQTGHALGRAWPRLVKYDEVYVYVLRDSLASLNTWSESEDCEAEDNGISSSLDRADPEVYLKKRSADVRVRWRMEYAGFPNRAPLTSCSCSLAKEK